jgi:ABC-type multidrug transport system ATPase subunit
VLCVQTVNEKEVQKALDEMLQMHKGVALVIAHRLTTIKNCDQIIVIDKGKRVEQGTHKQLLKLTCTFANDDSEPPKEKAGPAAAAEEARVEEQEEEEEEASSSDAGADRGDITGGAKNGSFFGVFPMFVPSLSWQNVRLYI